MPSIGQQRQMDVSLVGGAQPVSRLPQVDNQPDTTYGDVLARLLKQTTPQQRGSQPQKPLPQASSTVSPRPRSSRPAPQSDSSARLPRAKGKPDKETQIPEPAKDNPVTQDQPPIGSAAATSDARNSDHGSEAQDSTDAAAVSKAANADSAALTATTSTAIADENILDATVDDSLATATFDSANVVPPANIQILLAAQAPNSSEAPAPIVEPAFAEDDLAPLKPPASLQDTLGATIRFEVTTAADVEPDTGVDSEYPPAAVPVETVTTDGSHHHTNLLTASASTEILGEPLATTNSQAEPTGNATADDSAFAPKDGDVLGKVPGTSAAGHAAQSQIPQQAASAQAQTPVQPKELQEPAARPSASTDEPHATPRADKEQNAATAANASAAIHSPLQRGIVSAGEPTPAGSQSVVQTKVDVSQNAIQSSVSEVVHNSEPTAVDPVAGSGNPVPVSAGQTTQIPTANSPLEINPQQLVEKLGSAIHQAQENGGHLKIRLHPPELGTVQIEVSMRNGVLSARLEVQTAAAQQALTEHMGLLRDAIAQTGMHVDQIDVRIAESEASDGSSQTDQQQQQQQQFEQQSQQQPDGGEFDRENDAGIREPVTSAQASASLMDQLDIQV